MATRVLQANALKRLRAHARHVKILVAGGTPAVQLPGRRRY